MDLNGYYTACPCCRNITIPNFGDAMAFICPVCYWEIDPFCDSPFEESDLNNGLTIIEAQENYQKYQAVLPRLYQYVRRPKIYELPGNAFHYKQVDGSDKDFYSLSVRLDEYLNHIAGGEENRSQYIQYNRLDDIQNGVLIYEGTRPIACAGFKKLSQDVAEVKRVFMDEEYRGVGLSYRLMRLLEYLEVNDGFKRSVLETGEPLIEALNLYYKIGYDDIPNYGQYKDMPESICMEKIF